MASLNHGVLLLLSLLLLVTPTALAVHAISATCTLSSTSTSTIDSLDPITTTAHTESLYSCSSTAAPAARISDVPASKDSAVGDHHGQLLQEATAAAATNCTAKVTMSPIISLDSAASQISSNCSVARTPQSAPYLLSSSDCAATFNFSAASTAISTACEVSATSKSAHKSRSGNVTSRCTTTPATSTTHAGMTTTSTSSSCSSFQSLSPPPRRIASWSNCTSLASTPTSDPTSTSTSTSCSSFAILWNGPTITTRTRSSINCTTSSSSVPLGNDQTSSVPHGTILSESSCSVDTTIFTIDTPTPHQALFSASLKNPLLSIIPSLDDHPDF